MFALGQTLAGRQPRRLLALLAATVTLVAIVQTVQHGQSAAAALLVFLAVVGIVCPLADAALSRRDEYTADRYAACIGHGQALIAALAGFDGGQPRRGLLGRLTAWHLSVQQRLEGVDKLNAKEVNPDQSVRLNRIGGRCGLYGRG